MGIDPRKYGLALAQYVVSNVDDVIPSEHLGAIIYRIRVVDVYSVSDVDLVCKSMKNLVDRLTLVGTQSFCSEVWLALIMAIAEGVIDPEWKIMVDEVDIKHLALPYLENVEEMSSWRQTLKTSEQIGMICEVLIIESDLIRRVFTAIWNTNLDETVKNVCLSNWDAIYVRSDEISTKQAVRIIEMRFFEYFRMMKDHQIIATNIFFVSIARMIIRVSNVDDGAPETFPSCESPFYVCERVLSKLWMDLCNVPEIRKHTLTAFDKLIREAVQHNLHLRSLESLEEICGWLKISHEEICESLEDTLWTVFFKFINELLDFNTNLPLEMVVEDLKITHGASMATIASPEDFESVHWLESICEKIPAMMDEKSAEEKVIRKKIDRTRGILNFILEILMKAKHRGEGIQMMTESYAELISTRETEIAARVKNVYKSLVDRNVITEEDQMKLASDVIKSDAIQEVKAIFLCTKEESASRNAIAKLYFEQIIEYIKKSENNEEINKKLELADQCVGLLVRYLTRKATVEIVKKLVEILNKEGPHNDFAMKLFSKIVETSSPTEFAQRDQIGWYLDFQSLELSHDTWNFIFSKLAEANSKDTEKKVFSGLTVLSFKQLTSNELSLKELFYVFRRLGYQKTGNGKQCLKKFYNNCSQTSRAIEFFTDEAHILQLAERLLRLLSENILKDKDWQEHSHSFELIMPWLTEFNLLEKDEIISSLVGLSNAIASLQLLWTLGITTDVIKLEDIYCFSRFWKCEIVQKLPIKETEFLETQLFANLRQCHERSPSDKFITKRSGQESQLIEMFNEISLILIQSSKKLLETDKMDEELFGWLTCASCGGGAFKIDLINEAKSVMSKKFKAEEVERLQRMHIMYFLMGGATSRSTSDSISLSEYFTSLYIILLKSDVPTIGQEEYVGDLDRYMGTISSFMQECADSSKRSNVFSESFMIRLGMLMLDLKTTDPIQMRFLEKLVEIFLKNIHFLPGWVKNAKCPITFLASMSKLLDFMFNSKLAENYKENMQKALIETIPIVLNEKTAEIILSSAKFVIQFTDKRFFSALNFRVDILGLPESAIDQISKNEQYLLQKAVEVFSLYGEVDVHLTVVRKLIEILPAMINSIAKHESILAGKKKIFDDKSLIFNMMLTTEMIEYCCQIVKTIYPADTASEEDFDLLFMLSADELHRKHQLIEANCCRQTYEKNESAKNETATKSSDACTFKKTGTEFELQHWYNCHTCSMTDAIGVCSVCAINCHRGHDISYSKKGSFFCDCGANGCGALSKIEHCPSVGNAIRGQLPVQNAIEATKIKISMPYELKRTEKFEGAKRDEMINELKNLNTKLVECQKIFETVMNAVENGNVNAQLVAEKRSAVVNSFDGSELQKLEVSWDTIFMEDVSPLPERANIVAARRIDNSQATSGTGGGNGGANMTNVMGSMKLKELADVMLLENGTEVWIVIPENTQTNVHLYYMDTRSSLVGGMLNVRQEQEQLSFVARRVSVSGNRVAICGSIDVVALRFSPKGDIIDRAHFKVADPLTITATSIYSNPVVKTIWCRELNRQLLTVATSQFVRVYDLTLDMSKFVEEMVLPVGNVEDIVIISKNDKTKLMILSTTGFLYEHFITSTTAENNSFFLTNVINMPYVHPNSLGAGISLYYSYTYDLLFVSLEKATFFTKMTKGENASLIEGENAHAWTRLMLNQPIHCWKEAGGIISCLSSTTSTIIYYLSASSGNLMAQKTVVKRPILSQFLMSSAKKEAVYSVLLYADMPTIEIQITAWRHTRDLWIDDEPSELVALEVTDNHIKPEGVPKEDLVLLNEGCDIITNVEWTSPDLILYYENGDLNNRLNGQTPAQIYVVQMEKFKLTAKIPNSRLIIRGVRLDVPAMNGPTLIKIGTIEYELNASATRNGRIFDIRLTRDESLSLDHREIEIEIRGTHSGAPICLRSLKFIGCDRELMDEIQPLYHNQPTFLLPHRFVKSFLELKSSMIVGNIIEKNEEDWLKQIGTKHLSRRNNHPSVSLTAVHLLQRMFMNEPKTLLETIDSDIIEDWKFLKTWKPEKGMIEFRRKHVEYLIRRLEAVQTRWKLFEELIKKNFGSIVSFMELLRDEMVMMPISKCSVMAQGLTRLLLGFLVEKSDESNVLTNFFLNMFTDDKTFHLTNDIRSAVQVAVYRYGWLDREDRLRAHRIVENKREASSDNSVPDYGVALITGTMAFYAKSNIFDKSIFKHLNELFAMTGEVPIEFMAQKINIKYEWLNNLVEKTIRKMSVEGHLNSMPNIIVPMIDSPSYGHTMIVVSILSQFYTEKTELLIDKLIDSIKMEVTEILPLNEKNFRNFALLRLLEQLIGRFLAIGKKEAQQAAESSEKKEDYGEEKLNVAKMLAKIYDRISEKNILDLCYQMLDQVLVYLRKWKIDHRSIGNGLTGSHASNELNRKMVWLPYVPLVASSANPPNIEGYTESNAKNPDGAYHATVTELALRIPMLMHKVREIRFDENWYRRLCELTCITDVPGHRQSKKLLLLMCNNDKLKYRAMRDKYKMQENLEGLLKKYVQASQNCGGHQQLTEIVDVLNQLSTLAELRQDMWRDICDRHMISLMKLACFTTDVIACSVINLIIIAVRENSGSGAQIVQLADRIIEADDGALLNKIINRFLIGKDENMRWIVHGLLRSTIQLASRQNQATLMRRLYLEIYPLSQNCGTHAAQLVDLIATYSPRLFNSGELLEMCDAEMRKIEEVAKRFDTEGHAGTYKQMMEIGIGWKAMLFNENPCLVCFNRKGSTESMKLMAIKSDSRFSTNAMMFKLNSNYEISKVSIKLSDVKKTKSIKKVTVYYCAKAVEGVVELKLSPDLWRRCGQANVSPNESQINVTLAVPIVTSSLIVEFNELHEQQSSDAQLHCPRCSIQVRAPSGLCENCGENAYQCIKCRSINYVERDPFLCQACGFCKYARLDVSVMCRQLPGTQHITCDQERSQSIEEMSKLLSKMETSRAKLIAYKAYCEALYLKTRPLAPFSIHVENKDVAEYFGTHALVQISYSAFQSTVSTLAQLSHALKTVHDEICIQTEQIISLRDELKRYDESNETPLVFNISQNQGFYSTSRNCFGCMCAAVVHSIALLNAVCEDETTLHELTSMTSLYQTIGRLSSDFEPLREECETLFIRIMMDNEEATRKFEKMIEVGKIDVSILAKSLQQVVDTNWQQKLKFLIRYTMQNPSETNSVQTLMVLNKFLETSKPIRSDIYQRLMKRKKGKSIKKLNGEKEEQKEKASQRIKVSNHQMTATRQTVTRWLVGNESWNDCVDFVAGPSTENATTKPFNTIQYEWIATCIFSPWTSVRAAANRLLVNMSKQPGHEGVAIWMLIEWLEKLEKNGISANLFDQFIHSTHLIVGSSAAIKARLFIERFHVWLIRRIHSECAAVHRKENEMLLMDHSFGVKLRCYVELLCLLFSGSSIENILLKAGADDLLVYLLQSTIFLKRMVTRRTRSIDSSRVALEKLLRRISSRDGSKLMKACVESLRVMKDTKTLGHIVSVILEVMDPQKEADEDFQIQIEKDAAQEDFLQGRMSGNPYKSSDSGMGPLMRDVKNKICRDTEMIALMEDDNGMELLVNNNIISLSLPVRQVYEKLWKRRETLGTPMLIVYRMRGLMGDAVETFISSFGGDANNGDTNESEDDESLVAITRTLVEIGGLTRLLDLLKTSNVNSSGRFLLGQLRRIFERIAKTSTGRKALVEQKMIRIMIKVVRECCNETNDDSKLSLGMEFYKVMEAIVLDASIHPLLNGIDKSDAEWIIGMYDLKLEKNSRLDSISERVRKSTQHFESMAMSIGNIFLGDNESEQVLVDQYHKVLQWKSIDRCEALRIITEREDLLWMAEQLTTITKNLLASKRGIDLKTRVLNSGIVEETCNYLMLNHPPLYSPTESSEWKQYLQKPSLKVMLNFLFGMTRWHVPSQMAIASSALPLLHRLEQVASENSIGTLAENVMEALNETDEVRAKIVAVRHETKMKKRQLAMAMRNKQLSKMGMQIGKSGEVKVASRQITNEPALEEESDEMSCCICRESVLSGTKVAGVYAFASTSQPSSDQSAFLSSVSQMVLVHHDCHNNAIRRTGSGRNIDEWSKAMLHNAGAKCNILTPIAIGLASDDQWEMAMSRYKTDYEHIVPIPGGITRHFLFLDICRIVDRFIFKQSFSSQSHGGGRESNMQYLAILHLLALHQAEGENDLTPPSPHHRLVTFWFTELTVASWNEQKHDVIRVAVDDAKTSGGCECNWPGLKSTLITWALVDTYFNRVIPINGDDRLAWLQANLRSTITKTRNFVQYFDENLMKCESIEEFCDVTEVPRDLIVPSIGEEGTGARAEEETEGERGAEAGARGEVEALAGAEVEAEQRNE